MPLVDSFRKRYFYKAAANGIAVIANVITQSIIPRALGAVWYGNFYFLTDSFTQVMSFLNMNSSIAFYTKLSKRPDERKLVPFYFLFIVAAVLVAFVGVALIIYAGLAGRVWLHIPLCFVYAACGLAGITWLFNSVNDIADAHALTVNAEIAKVLQRLIGLGLIAVLFFMHWLNMSNIFQVQYVLTLMGLLFLIIILDRADRGFQEMGINFKDIKVYLREFYQYSKPLIWRTFVVSILVIFDRWFLQREAGGAQQGFYTLSFKVEVLCFVLAGAMTQLIMREFSIAHQNNDLGRMGHLFRRNIPLMYGLTTIICCFVAVNADKVALIMGGHEFKGLAASLPVMIMAFYPMHQTYGQLSNVVFFATDQTKIYATITMASMIIGLPFTYFLIASPLHHGLGAGAVGLAVKMVSLSIVTNNVLLWFNTRYLKLSFPWFVWHQLICFAVFFGIAFLVTYTSDHWFMAQAHIICKIMVSSTVYLTFIGLVIYIYPVLFGIDRVILRNIFIKGKVL